MWTSFLSDRAGGVGLVFGLGLVTIVGAAAVAFDYEQAASRRTDLQKSTDQAAIAGLTRAAMDAAERERLAAQIVRSAPVTVESVNAVASPGEIVVEARASVPTVLMRVVGIPAVDVSALSRAQVRDALPCILVLEPAANAVEINSDSTLQAGCGVQVNSRDAEAIFANSRSHLRATDICVVGDVRLDGGSTTTPEAETGCAPRPDPLASLPEPSEAGRSCDYSDLVVNAGETAVLRPGVYCSKLEINSDSHVTLEPGIYVMRDGELIVNSRSTVTGSDVMIFFQGKEGRLNVNSDSRVTLSAPRSGTYAGILFFQSRASETLDSDYHILNSDGTSKLEGALYFPNGQLMLNSISTANVAADWTALITRRLVLNSFGTFVANAKYTSDTPVPAALAGMGGERSVVLVH